MDEQQQRQINEAAQQFANALKDSYQAVADRSVSAQEINAQLTQDFFNHRPPLLSLSLAPLAPFLRSLSLI